MEHTVGKHVGIAVVVLTSILMDVTEIKVGSVQLLETTIDKLVVMAEAKNIFHDTIRVTNVCSFRVKVQHVAFLSVHDTEDCSGAP
jgi:hypothetical protein